ncbi:MAG: hypothetical protein KAR37_10110 [Alphaproteobacteria bacterium]|nr:hypothetical protein [Alphaproteobacteria bacterium]
MRPTDARTAIPQWRLRLARAARWALLGALSFLLGWAIVYALDSWRMNVSWQTGWWLPYGVSLWFLIMGLAYTGGLGFAIHRTRLVGWRRAAGFAVLAMPWFVFGWNSGVAVYDIVGGSRLPVPFLIWFVGLFTAGAWVTLAGVLLLPFLRSRMSVAWLFAASVASGALAGGRPGADLGGLFDDIPYVVAAWCAVYAAVFSMTLPRARPGGHQIASHQGDPGQGC